MFKNGQPYLGTFTRYAAPLTALSSQRELSSYLANCHLPLRILHHTFSSPHPLTPTSFFLNQYIAINQINALLLITINRKKEDTIQIKKLKYVDIIHT